jgi:GNAT superfamily N-acetyltransferase
MAAPLRLADDAFLSEAFAVRWLRVEPEVEAASLPALAELVAAAPAGAKIDVTTSDPAALGELGRRGWRLGNTKLTFERAPGPLAAAERPSTIVEPLRPEHAGALVRSAHLFQLDRYRHDPDLDGARVPALYERWLSNNIASRSETILTAVEDGELIGFCCVIRKSAALVYAELIGVMAGHQGKGVGRLLVGATVRAFPSCSVEVVTQLHNVPMQRVLVRCGFEPVAATYVLTRTTT